MFTARVQDLIKSDEGHGFSLGDQKLSIWEFLIHFCPMLEKSLLMLYLHRRHKIVEIIYCFHVCVFVGFFLLVILFTRIHTFQVGWLLVMSQYE